MSYRDYQNTRNAAWKILLDCGVDSLPVNIDDVCQKLGIRVLSYDVGAEVIERAHLFRAVRHTDGLTFYLKDVPVILFDETRDLSQVMFTIAHELGHLILNHVQPGTQTTGHRGAEWKASPEERAANQFAVRLLAPACVLWALDVHTPEEIMRLCHLTQPAAKVRARRMEVLYQRQRFLTSPLEQALYHQFQPYIAGAGSLHSPEG